MEFEDLKNAELGGEFDIRQLQSCCRAIYGGVAWPGKNPGCAVVMAMSRQAEKPPWNDTDSYEVCVVDVVESDDTRELILQCRRLDAKWQPELWFGETNDAAEEFMAEANEDMERYFNDDDRRFDLGETHLLDIQNPYPYVLGTLKELLGERPRRLFLKEGIIKNYLGQIKPDEVAELKRGDFPAVEAVGIAVIEMLRVVKHPCLLPSHTGDDSVYRDDGEFDHLLRPGATDPGWEYDDEDDEWGHTV